MNDIIFDASSCAARLDRLPITSIHRKIQWIIGSAIFFDAFDVMMVALTLPILARTWHLNVAEIGAMISIGYVGQAIGALVSGWLAEKFGRIKIFQFFVVVFSLLSIASALSQNYPQMLLFRFLAGLGLGGEMPVGATYMSEFAPKKSRGRYFLFYQFMFTLGFLGSSFMGALILPHFGWRIFYAVGGLPVFLIIAIKKYCPESARWLIANGEVSDAKKIIEKLELKAWKTKKNIPNLIITNMPTNTENPQKTSFFELFSKIYLKRTLTIWIIWVTTYSIVYGAIGWVPSLLQHVYHIPLQKTLNLMFISTLVVTGCNGVSIFLIDKVGRRLWFKCVFLLVLIEFCILAWVGSRSLGAFTSLGFSAIGIIATVAFILYLYTPEIYPTRMRAIGVGCATFWMRIASIIAPLLVGHLLPVFGISGVFSFFAISAAVGLVASFFGKIVDTSGKTLEEVSP